MNVDLRQRRDAFENFHRLAFYRAHSSHTGIDFEIDRRFADSIKCLRFLEYGNGWNKAAFDDRWHFLGKRWTKNDHRKGKSFAERDRFVQIGDAEQLHLFRES